MDNVFDLKTRGLYVAAQLAREVEEQALAESVAALQEAQRSDGQEAHVSVCKSLLALVEKGDIEGLVIIGWHKPTQLFYTEIVFPYDTIPPQDAFKFTGALSLITDEFKEISSMAPCVMSDGTILDPETMVPTEEEMDEEGENE